MYYTLKQPEWEPGTIPGIGHSMGSFTSLTFVAAFSVKHLVMLDSRLGQLTKPAGTVSTSIRNHIKQRIKGKPSNSVFPKMTICLTAITFPGDPYNISKETATDLVAVLAPRYLWGDMTWWQMDTLLQVRYVLRHVLKVRYHYVIKWNRQID
jgi:hypothetical protein